MLPGSKPTPPLGGSRPRKSSESVALDLHDELVGLAGALVGVAEVGGAGEGEGGAQEQQAGHRELWGCRDGVGGARGDGGR